jgi:hypothetical protein
MPSHLGLLFPVVELTRELPDLLVLRPHLAGRILMGHFRFGKLFLPSISLCIVAGNTHLFIGDDLGSGLLAYRASSHFRFE